MKIIHLILGKANPNRMNGVNKVVNNLAIHQFEMGYDVSVWGITHTPNAPIPHRNYSTKLFPALKHKLWVHPALKKALKKTEKDTVFHIHGGFIPEFYHVYKLLKKHNIPYVHTAHGAYNVVAMQRSKWIKRFYFHFFEKALLKQAKALHFIGESEMSAVQLLMKHESSVLIPNGQTINQEAISSKSYRNAPIFGFCGRFDVHTKGLDILLQAFADYYRCKPFTELWLIGDGPQRSKLEELAKQLGIEKHVVFLGKQFGNKKDELFQQIDLFFYPSRNEGLPGAVLEAAAMKIPCVVSKESNMGTYIEKYKAGKCLPKNNANMLTQAMLEMYSVWADPIHYCKMQRNTHLMLKKIFDWNVITVKMIQLYTQISK